MTTRREFLAASAVLIAPAAEPPPTLFELRRYRTVPARRDDLIAMFERDFLDAYQAGGTRVLGTFRDLDHADRWVWMRAFPDAPSRGAALAAFYGSAAWKAGSAAANATIEDAGDARLLRLVRPASFPPAPPAPGEADAASLVVATVMPLVPGSESRFEREFVERTVTALARAGAAPFAIFATDRRENAFPRQPIRDDAVLVAFTRFASVGAHERFAARDAAPLPSPLAAPLETLRLAPTARSAFR